MRSVSKKHCRSIALLLAAVFLSAAGLFSCADTKTKSDADARFPLQPDSIVIGSGGREITVTAEDKAYEEIVARVQKLVEKSTAEYAFDTYKMSAYDAATQQPLAQLVRQRETFVEYWYQTETEQLLPAGKEGGAGEGERISVRMVQFPLTGEYHRMFFVGYGEDELSYLPPFGDMTDDLSLIRYVQDLVAKAQ